jgi:hypothetical protein
MSTKSEERMKQMLEEYLELKQQKQSKEISDHIYSIFLWGVLFGTIFSYMSFMPVLFGTMFGYVMSKKQWILIDRWMEGWIDWVRKGETYWRIFWKENQKENQS